MLIHFRRILLLILLFCSGVQLVAQPGRPMTQYNFQLETKVHYGFFAQHHFEMETFNSHFPGFELILQRSTFGSQRWEILYDYPLVGLAAWYSPMGNIPEIGASFALFPFINFPLNIEPTQNLYFRTGVGLAYLSNKFEARENFRNFAIGSTLNVAISLNFDYRYRISEYATITATLGLTHFSNGSMKTPNYGINIPTVSVGFSTYLRKPNHYLDRMLLPELYIFEFGEEKNIISIEPTIAFGTKDMTEQLEERFMVYHLSLNVLKPVSFKTKIGIGLDATYDFSHPRILEQKGAEYSSNLSILKPGLTAIYEMVMMKTSFIFQLGGHLAGAEQSSGAIYQKIGLKHYLYEKLFGSITLTAHFGKADYIGFGLGYRFDIEHKKSKK